jgi:hypothetical protein
MNSSASLVMIVKVWSTSSFFRDAHGTYRLIGPPVESWSGYSATGINVYHQIVGGYAEHGWVWTGDEYMTIHAPGADFTLPHSINNKGHIGGVACLQADCWGWTLKHGVFQTIRVPGSIFTSIFEIIDNGRLAGSWYGPNGRHYGFAATPK